jgi:outer membrane protein OmpA-like peptidoglycan-associated protein
MRSRTIALSIICVLLAVSLLACAGASKQEKGTGIGAATGAGIGAILGQAIGRDTKGTLIGAGAGAIVGALAGNQIGKYMDNQERELRQAMAQQEQASVQRQQEVLRATFNSEVFFDFDSAQLKQGGRRELERVADVLNKYRKTTIRVEGHTDQTGPEQYNQQLSERRAQAVKDALIQMGVIKERIEAVGYGETQPISSSPAQNRRVELFITPIRKG